jgi:hypothetical protein
MPSQKPLDMPDFRSIRVRLDRHFGVVLVVFVISLIVVIVMAWPQGSTNLGNISGWRGPGDLITQPDSDYRDPNRPTPDQGIVDSAAPVADGRFRIAVANGVYPGQMAAIERQLEEAFRYSSDRFTAGQPLNAPPFTASLAFSPECQLHGITYPEERIVQVFTCSSIPLERPVAIMAHEFVHQLEYDRYGPAHMQADSILSEGVATWAAGKYWLGSYPDFRIFVRDQRRAGVLLPLATNPVRQSGSTLNTLYYQWASFVEFLLERPGRSAAENRALFDRLYVSGNFEAGSSDYAGVYGMSLAELEQEWLAWLGQ